MTSLARLVSTFIQLHGFTSALGDLVLSKNAEIDRNKILENSYNYGINKTKEFSSGMKEEEEEEEKKMEKEGEEEEIIDKEFVTMVMRDFLQKCVVFAIFLVKMCIFWNENAFQCCFLANFRIFCKDETKKSQKFSKSETFFRNFYKGEKMAKESLSFLQG